MEAFLSHNQNDKEIARKLGAQLKLAGADIWFDEWEIRAGDSIPGKVNEALDRIDSFILLWSDNADASNWVRTEVETVLHKRITEETLRVIPVLLDGTPLPPLLRPTQYVDLRDDDLAKAVAEIMGFANEQGRIKAIQETLEEAQIEVGYFYGYGAAVGCPNCGASLKSLEAWEAVDESRDDLYAGVRCKACRWEGGGEVW